MNVPAMILMSLLALTVAQGAQSADFYDTVSVGTLKGKLTVQWIEPDIFLFVPDTDSPLTFTRSNGEKIVPGRMLTDGGSVPRPLWILRNYSPWGYAPAFVVHDWLFEVHHCQYDGFKKYSYKDAASIMSEIMKTMMVLKKVEVDRLTLWSMHAAVASPIAEKQWDSGKCNPPPPGMFGGPKPLREYTIDFD
jgi:hypothetical protein